MSSTSGILLHSSPVWDETTIIEKGMSFLNQKKEELESYRDLWDASMKVDIPKEENDRYENSAPEKARRTFQSIARQSRSEIKQLKKEIESLIFLECEKNPSSQQIQRLLKITFVATHGLNYFNSIIEAISEKSLSNKEMTFRQKKPYSRNINPVLEKIASYANTFGFVGLATVAYSVYHGSPFWTLISSIITVAGQIKLYGINIKRNIHTIVVYELNSTQRCPLSWNLTFGNEPSAVKVGMMKNIFEKALLGENVVVDYIHVPNEKIIDGTLKLRSYEDYIGSKYIGGGTNSSPEMLQQMLQNF